MVCRLALILGGTGAGIVLCAIIVTIVYRPPGKFYVHPPGFETTIKPIAGRHVPGVHGEARFKINSQGMRGNEFSDEQGYRILVLGGSTVICVALDETEVWTRLVQDSLNELRPDLNVWVGNAGRSGLTTRSHVVQVKFLLPQLPRIDAVLLLIGINDLMLRLKQDSEYNPQFMNLPNIERQLVNKVFSSYPPAYRDVPFYKRTALWHFGARLKSRLRPRDSRMIDVALQNPPAWSARIMRNEPPPIPPDWAEHRRQASAMLDQLPDIESALDEYERNINRIIDILHADSIRPVFLTQPTMYRPDLTESEKNLLWMGGIGDYQNGPGHVYYSAGALAEGMELYNRRLVAVCSRREVECFDLARVIPKDTTNLFDDCHFTEAGARNVAQAVSGYFAERPPFAVHPDSTDR